MDNKELALPPTEVRAFAASPSSPTVSPVPASIPREDDYDDFIDDGCYECGGDGFVSDCVEEWACVDPDYGCDYCTRPCPLCNPHKRGAAILEKHWDEESDHDA